MKKITEEQGQKLVDAFQNIYNIIVEIKNSGVNVGFTNPHDAFDNPEHPKMIEDYLTRLEHVAQPE